MLLTATQLEKAARALCEMRGEDPNVSVQRNDLWDTASYCPRWENAAREITEHERIVSAINIALGLVKG